MTKQIHLRRVRQNKNSRPNAACRVTLLMAVILTLCLSPSPAKAQFSGPALGLSTPVNLPVTPTTDPAILYPVGRDIILEQG
ncbi:MAG: hypothetical protein ABI158_07825, partial [Edaphobacter sp.]